MGSANPVTILEDTVDTVGDVAGGIVDGAADLATGVVEAVVEPVAKAVDNTIQAAINDPVGTAAMVVTAIYAPYLLPAVSAANTVAHGGSLEDAAKSAAISYAAGQVGSGVGAETGSNIAAGSATGASSAALRGGDIGQGAISGGINAGIGDAAKSISDANFEDWAKEQASNTYDNAPSPTEQDVLDYMDSAPATEAQAPDNIDIGGGYNPASGNLSQANAPDNIDVGGGYNPATNQGDQGYYNENGEWKSSPLDSVVPPIDSTAPEAYDPALTTNEIKQGLIFAKNALLAQDQQKNRLAGIKTNANSMCLAMGGADNSIPWLNTKEQMLRNQPRIGCASTQDAGAKAPDLQSIYNNLNPELTQEFANRGIGNNLMRGDTPVIGGFEMKGYAAAGSVESETCSTWGAMGKFMPKFHPVSGSGMLAAGGKRQQSGLAPLKHMYSGISPSGNMGGMAKGGLPSKYHDAAPDGHNPEFVTGLTGYYACGGGTGQSDDIPAMLHDGDYVMDAEAVSALGDGSSKAGREVLEGFRKQVPHKDGAQGKPVPAKIADGEYVFPASFVSALGGGDNKKGADILNGLREKLRTHKRSAPTSKIPPKAKSPLDYIKGSKG